MKASKKQTNDIEHTHRDDIPPRLATRLELLGRKLQGLAVLLQGLVDESAVFSPTAERAARTAPVPRSARKRRWPDGVVVGGAGREVKTLSVCYTVYAKIIVTVSL